jgi:diguanylate cyclase (GGDEF)-like protein
VTVHPVLRVALVCAIVAGLARAWGDQGFWACVPGAVVLAATVRPPRVALVAAAAAVGLTAALAPPPALAPAVVVPIACIGAMLATRVRLERERDAMRRSALRDPLTGLANRRALDDLLRYEVARHARHGTSFVVLALDLDGFKAVNDRFGHDAGDEVLRDAAAAIEDAVRGQDTVFRLGGDEFCVLAPQTDRESANRLGARVLDSLANVTTGVAGLTASVGAAVYPADGTQPTELLAAADAAALQVKRRSRMRRTIPRRAA